MGSHCDELLWELGVEVRPRQASVLACIVLMGTSEGLVSPRFLRELVVVGVVAPSDLTGSIIVEILRSVEGGDIEQACLDLEIILPCLRLIISLSLMFIYLEYF